MLRIYFFTVIIGESIFIIIPVKAGNIHPKAYQLQYLSICFDSE